MSNALKIVAVVAVVAIIGASGFIGGFVVAKTDGGIAVGGSSAFGSSDPVADHVVEVRELLDSEALEPPSETSATAGAVQGLLESGGDKYGVFFDAEHFEFFNEDMAGEFGGIGVLLAEKDGTAYVVEVYKDTPAYKGGIKSGDIFSAIDGVTRDKWTSDEVVKRVRGKEGTDVELTMFRPPKGDAKDGENPHEPYTVVLTRDIIEFPNVESRMESDDVGYIRLGQFNGQATEDITAEIEKLEKKGARSLVLDLRDNPGGALDQAVKVSSLFIADGVVVRVDERNKPETEYRTDGRKVTDAPLVVLINGNSASASEIVGGALQDYGRATLVGETSFGKGSVQTVKELSFGGAVKFTTAHYLTPKKRVIDGKGLTPDVEVKMEMADQADPKTDTQLKRAIAEAKKAAR